MELGPGHNPLDLPFPGVAVRYVDRWEPGENRLLFPELGDEAPFPEPDVIADFNVDRLTALDDASQEFVICSHLLEHLAEPIGFLREIHRVLRPGGLVLILLPDRHRTFDRDRAPTSLAHLVAEYEAGVTEVDDAHLIDFLKIDRVIDADAVVDAPISELVPDGEELSELYRLRSIHVHCWDDEEFFPVLVHGVEKLGERWELVDGLLTDEGGPGSIEFGYVLRRSTSDVEISVLAERLVDTWQVWRATRASDMRQQAEAMRQLGTLQSRVADILERQLAARPQPVDTSRGLLARLGRRLSRFA